MRYKFCVSTANHQAAKKLHKLLENSPIYAGKDSPPISLSMIIEVCDECEGKVK